MCCIRIKLGIQKIGLFPQSCPNEGITKGSRSLTVLVYQHANADSVYVESVEEILNSILDVRGNLWIVTLHLKNSLRHGLNDRRMPIPNGIQRFTEPKHIRHHMN